MPEIRIVIPENMDIALNTLIRAGLAGNKAEIVRGAITQYLTQVPTILSKDYDLESVFSPDGRILQVEYAMEASNKGLLSIGLQCKDGLLLIKEKPPVNHPKFPFLKNNGYFRPLKKLTDFIEISIAGIHTDGKLVLKEAAALVEKSDPQSINIYSLAESLSFFLHGYTLKKDLRVLGTQLIMGGLNLDGETCLFLIGPSGTIHEASIHAMGTRSESFINELLPKYEQDLLLKDAIPLAMKIVLDGKSDVERLLVDILTNEEKKFKELTLEQKKDYLQ